MYHAMTREARRGRGKAREMSRRLTRAAREANSLSQGETTTLWVVGGLAAAGLGVLAYQSWKRASAPPLTPPSAVTPSSSATPTATTPAPTSPSPAPASPTASAPAAATTAAVTWPSTAMPWSPPRPPADLPAGYTVNDDLGAVDPMYVAMAQSALHILKNALPANTPANPLSAYSDPVNGNVTAGFTESIIYVQTTFATASQTATLPPGAHAPRMDGVLDLKTLSMLATTILSASAVTLPLSPTATADPAIASIVISGLTNMANFASTGAGSTFANYIAGVRIPINLSSALATFQSNMNALRPSLLPTYGYQNTQVDWATAFVIVGLAG